MNLKSTGERLITDYSMGKGAIEHLHRYAITIPFITKKKVLDIASGEGYGTNIMAQYASSIIGVDISDEAVNHAKEKYKKHNLNYIVGSAFEIPLEDNSVDVVVSFETLEHHDKHDEMFKEIKRVLNSTGILIISTPQKENYHAVDPNNVFHIKELTGDEFNSLVNKYFTNYKIFKQKYIQSSLIYSVGQAFKNVLEYKGDFQQVHSSSFDNSNMFNIAVACNDTSNEIELPISLYAGDNFINEGVSQIYKANDLKLEEALKVAYNSNSYKIGNLILKPFSFIKNLFKS
jgi:ubiquinone/menaquinone biosynthesis C-methylase UbiE